MEQFKSNNQPEPAARYDDPIVLAGTTHVTVRDLVGILRRRAPLALTTFALTVAAAFLVTLRMTPTYEATAKMILDDVPSAAVPNNVLDILNGHTSSSGEVEVAKIKSRGFLADVIKEAGIGAVTNPDDMKGRLAVAMAGNDKIMEITATMKKDPVMTARVANTVCSVYQRYVEKEGNWKIELSASRLRKSAEKAEKERALANAALAMFLRKRGISDMNAYIGSLEGKALNVRNALQDAERDLPLKEQSIGLFARQIATLKPTVVSGTSSNRNGQLDTFEDQIINLENERRIKILDFGDQSPEIQEIDRRIASAKSALRSLTGNAYRPGSFGITRNPDYAAAVTNFINAKRELAQARATASAYRKQLAGLQAQQFKLVPERVKYQELQQRADVTSMAYSKATTALLQIPINRITNLPNIMVLEAAEVPREPISPKPLLNTMLALFTGLFLAVMSAIAAEYFSSPAPAAGYPASVTLLPAAPVFSASLPSVAGVPLLARVSLAGGRIAATADGNLPPVGVSASTEDAFREIGYLLSHSAGSDPARVPVVLMAGTRTDETTASVAAYLTATLVRDGVRVTLVDGDRVEPRLHHVFGKPDAPGVTDILAGRLTADQALHVGAGGNLRFLAAGAKTDTTPLTEETLRGLYDALGRAADTDLVLISGPSVWSARLIAPMERAADGVVLVASDAQVAPDESVARARRILTNGYQPRLLGVIVGEEAVPDGNRPAIVAKSEVV